MRSKAQFSVMAADRSVILLTAYAVDGILELPPWEVEFTDEFEAWWNSLNEMEQVKVDVAVRLQSEYGPDLPFLSARR